MKIIKVCLAGLFGVGLVALAIAAPDFNGTWVRDDGKSDLLSSVSAEGKVERISPEIILVIRHQGNDLQIETRRNDKLPQMLNYLLDGAQNTLSDPKGGLDLVYRSQWEDDKLIITGTRKIDTPFGRTEIHSKDEWSLSADGKILTLTTTVAGSGTRDFVQKQVYRRRES